MSELNTTERKRCTYVAEKSKPETWHGEEPLNFGLDSERDQGGLGISEEWRCPHPRLDKQNGDDQLCIFHTDPEEVPDDVEESEALLDALDDAGTSPWDDGPEHRGQFVGATFGAVDLSGATIAATDEYDIRFDHAQFQVNDEDLNFNNTSFETSGDQRLSFYRSIFTTGGDGDVLFNVATFRINGSGDMTFLGATFRTQAGDVEFKDATFQADGDGTMRFSDATFQAGRSGDVKFEGATFQADGDGDVLFTDATFQADRRGVVKFEGATFQADGDGDVWLSDATFQVDRYGAVKFEDATFQADGDGDVLFTDATFQAGSGGDLWFKDATFQADGNGDLWFKDATFQADGNGDLWFKDATFQANNSGVVRFREATFHTDDGYVLFEGATFQIQNKAHVEFEEATFQTHEGGYVRFREATFRTVGDGHVRFKDATFQTNEGNGVLFQDAQFQADGDGDVRLNDATFQASRGGDVKFKGATFQASRGGDVWLNDATIQAERGGDVEFQDATFQADGDGQVKFCKAMFETQDKGHLRFREATFQTGGNGNVEFNGATFRTDGNGNVEFKWATFRTDDGYVWFKTRKSPKNGKESLRGFIGNVSFEAAQFHAKIRFDVYISTRSTLSFADASFYEACLVGSASGCTYLCGDFDFSAATFHEDIDFRGGRSSIEDDAFEGTADSEHQSAGSQVAQTFDASFANPVDFSGSEFIDSPDFSGIRFPEDTSFDRSQLSGANFVDADLSGASLERAQLNRAELLGTNLVGANLYGTLLGDAHINRRTKFWPEPTTRRAALMGAISTNGELRKRVRAIWKAIWKGGRIPYCLHDPRYKAPNGDGPEEAGDGVRRLEKAAEVYGTIENLAIENSMPRLASESFLGRKDVQRRQYWRDDDAVGRQWLMTLRSRVTNAVARYGESPWRVLVVGAFIVGACGMAYSTFDLVKHDETGGLASLLDSLYFSALTFTTLGYGDFSPANTIGKFLAVAETSMGVILLAILVFVFGRRATR